MKKFHLRVTLLLAVVLTPELLIAASDVVIAYANIIQYLAEKGAPVDWVALEPAVISVNTVMAGAKAMHPNAARLFIDFTLSKEG